MITPDSAVVREDHARDQDTPLVPLGLRITRQAEEELFNRLEGGWECVLVRAYSGTNAATTAAYKLTKEKKWRREPPEGHVLEFYTRRHAPGGPYGVYAHFVREDYARGQ